jgi:hypothetical protein
MQNRFVWVAFLLMCFLLTGLVGLFASYATSVPLERALYRNSVLDQALQSGHPDPAAIRAVLGQGAEEVLSGPGELASRIARAHTMIRAEASEEARVVGMRTRLMIGMVTVLAAGLGAGILLLASQPAQR